MPTIETDRKRLLATIAELGGRAVGEDDIVYEGTKFVLPEQFRANPAKGLETITMKFAELEKTANFSRKFLYRPWDGAYNAYQAMRKAFGFVTGQTIPGGFFSPDQPPTYVDVNVGVDQTEQVPWGRFAVPILEKTTIDFNAVHDPDYGQVFQMVIHTPRKNKHVVEGIFTLVAEELEANSIYKGKAFDGQEMPTFLDLSNVDPSKVVYSEQVMAQLEASVWAPIRYTEGHIKEGLPLKRAVLLCGTFGTGKTLAAYLTAKEAQAHGWTFILARPGKDDFMSVMQTARLYQPSVVEFEDAETVAAAAERDTISQLLDIFDGINAKGTKLMVVMTSNHPEVLHQGMMRPGRLDDIIEIGPLDDKGIVKLIQTSLGAYVDPAVDWPAVVEACKGYVPAFVVEAAQRSKRYAIARGQGSIKGLINTSDLVFAAQSLRSQYDRMIAAPESPERSSMEELHRSLTSKVVQNQIAQLLPNTEEYDVNREVWNADRVEEIRHELQKQNGSNN